MSHQSSRVNPERYRQLPSVRVPWFAASYASQLPTHPSACSVIA